MSLQRKIKQRKKRRTLRVRCRLLNPNNVPRVTVFRSLNNIYAQCIDDVQQKTIVSCSSLELKVSGDKTERAKLVGQELAKRALEKGIKHIMFDRGSYLFHGRVKSLVDGLRDGGLKI